MASGGGPRATGSGMKEEGKFRQRVDDHYKLMASAKKSIGLAGRLQLASSLGLGTAAGVAATLPEESSMVACIVSAVLMLVSGGAARAATAAAGAKDAEKHAATYAGWLKKLLALLIVSAAGATGLVAAEVLDPPPMPLVVAGGAVAALDLVGCLVGLRAAGQLLRAFELQKAKAKGK